jgi:hypothetical protein
MSWKFKYAKAQFNNQPNTRPTEPGGWRTPDPKRPNEGTRPGAARTGRSERRPRRT